MNETPTTTEPVRIRKGLKRRRTGRGKIPITNDTDQDLTDDDTADLEIFDGGNPGGVTDRFFFPAGGESFFEERFEVTDREEDVPRMYKQEEKQKSQEKI